MHCAHLVAPAVTKSDFGYEARSIASCQALLYASYPADLNYQHHHWVYSTMNTTIEAYWRQHRERSAQYWISVFNGLKDQGLFGGDIVEQWCLWAAYMPLLVADLEEVRLYHNAHCVRRQRNRIRPSGRPEHMYFFPQRYGGNHRGKSVSATELQDLMQHASLQSLDLPDYLPWDVRQKVNKWLRLNSVQINLENAKTIYVQLRDHFYRHLH